MEILPAPEYHCCTLFSPITAYLPIGQPVHLSAMLATLTWQEYITLMVAAELLGLHMQRGSGNFWLWSEST